MKYPVLKKIRRKLSMIDRRTKIWALIFSLLAMQIYFILDQSRYGYVDLNKVTLGNQIYLNCPHDVKIERTIDVVLATDNNYSPQCATVMASVLLNCDATSFFRFHILDGGITDENKSKIQKLKSIRPFDIAFYDMKKYDWSDLPLNLSWISSIATYYRLIISEILPKEVEKAIYLDCDVIVEQDLKNLYEIDISDKTFGACESIVGAKSIKRLKLEGNYFNAGVMLINLKRLQNFDVRREGIKYLKEKGKDIVYQDQDILNGLFNNDCKYLSLKWNTYTDLFFPLKDETTYTSKDAMKAAYAPAIIHFTGPYKPWKIICSHPLQREYEKYFKYTAFENSLFDEKNTDGFLRRCWIILCGFH